MPDNNISLLSQTYTLNKINRETNDKFEWNDDAWMRFRADTQCVTAKNKSCPINIYQLQISTFLQRESTGTPYTYRELASILPAYLKDMGYTHVDFTDDFCGCISDVASSQGDVNDFKSIINELHVNGLGVIFEMSANCFFENSVVSIAVSFAKEFHADGFYFKCIPQFIQNNSGSALAYVFRELNTTLHKEITGVLSIADGHLDCSSAYELGFDFLRDGQWELPERISKLDISGVKHIILAQNEYGKSHCLPLLGISFADGRSLIDRIHASYEDKFRITRLAMMLFMTLPGNKLLQVGNEFAQFAPRVSGSSPEWFMLDFPLHRYFRDYVAALNEFYLCHKELWEQDLSSSGVRLMDIECTSPYVLALKRISADGDFLIVLLSFSSSDEVVRVKTERAGELAVVFDTGNDSVYDKTIHICSENNEYFADIRIPRLSGLIMTQNDGTIKIKI